MERLTDEQADFVEKMILDKTRHLASKSCIIQAFADLRYYKQLSEKRGKALERISTHTTGIASKLRDIAYKALQEDTP